MATKIAAHRKTIGTLIAYVISLFVLPTMESILSLDILATKLVLLASPLFHSIIKVKQHPSIGHLRASVTPLIPLQVGRYLFTNGSNSAAGAKLMLGSPFVFTYFSSTRHTWVRARLECVLAFKHAKKRVWQAVFLTRSSEICIESQAVLAPKYIQLELPAL